MSEPYELPPDPLAGELDAFIESHELSARGRLLDREPAFPRREFESMGAAGWLGLTTPVSFGGRGLSIARAGVLLHRLAFRSGTTFAKLSLQPEFASVLHEVGSEALLDTWYRPLVAGRRLVGNQITEPGAGSDAQALQLAARRDPTGYSLSGEKTEVAFATEADAALVYGRVEGGETDGVTAFLVPQEGSGILRQVVGTDLGERWQRRGSVTYRHVHVPLESRLGEEGEGFSYVRAELTRERALLAAVYLGVARASWVDTVKHVGRRMAFGRPLSANQAVAFPLVDDEGDLAAGWLYVRQVLERLDRAEEVDAEAALAKSIATRVSLQALDHAIQFHGGRGYSNELPFEQRWRDVRSGSIAHGSSEIMHLVAARRLWSRRPAS
ncbi:MAG: acyl-CoA/acyl-ACP dehydrogenase [Thermoplasmata archaeon]|jgi:butyryl-CoA dehydrogenase|nr:acyl-CoA/acyl-ACP dehydrogenase [Thermoplasmata archaeon]